VDKRSSKKTPAKQELRVPTGLILNSLATKAAKTGAQQRQNASFLE
jgi:hypothetical protein